VIVVPSPARIKQGKKNSCSSQTAWKVKAAHFFEMSRTKHPMTQCDITGDLKPHTQNITGDLKPHTHKTSQET
jgi:hypothetical protein